MGSNYQQDVNLLQLFSDVSVYNNMINEPEHAEMAVDLACRSALGRRGVSHLTIPIDVQEQRLHGKYSRHKVPGHTSDVFTYDVIPNHELLQKAANILNSGNKIVILVGQGALAASDEVIAVCQRLGAVVIKALLGKGVIPDDSPYSLGGIGLLGTEPATDAMNEADTLLMVGTSFPYIDYLPKPGQAKGIQIDIIPERVGLRYPVDIGLVGDARLTLAALLPLLNEKHKSLEFLQSKQHAMKKWNDLLKEQSSRTDTPIKPQVIAAALSEVLEENAIISVDSGTITSWAARYINIKKGMKFSLSGSLASMGCGLPYAIAAQVAFPQRQSVAFVGDGGFSMLMGDFATAVQYNLPIKVIVIKNNTLGMIRWEQMAFLGNPEYGVEFTPIDFAEYAHACGGIGYSIRESTEVKAVMHEAMSQRKPTIVEAYVDPFDPPMPPKVEMEFIRKMAESFAKGQPYATRIGLTLYRNQVHEKFRGLHHHELSDQD
jgi:pyruvate dehydrogenase (quinone)/pyruvate oxidase